MLVTKLKKFNKIDKKLVINIVIFSILIACSFGMLGFYKNIEYASSIPEKQFLETEYLSGILKKNKLLFDNISIGGDDLQKLNSLDYVIFKLNRKRYNNANNNYLKDIEASEYKDLTYSTKELKQNYQWYIVFYYDYKGDLQVKDVYGADLDKTKALIEQIKLDEVSNDDIVYRNKAFPITNIVIAYGLPKGLVNEYFYIAIFILIVALLALAIPYKIEKETVVLNKLSCVSKKIKFYIYIILIPFGIVFSKNIIRSTLYKGVIYDIRRYLNISNEKAEFLTYGVNLIFWFILFLLIFLFVVLLKETIKDFKEKRIYIKDFSFKNNSYKWIIIVTIINFLGILSGYFLGIWAALVYSIIFFVALLSQSMKIKKRYDKLLNYAEEISKGKLDIDITDDLGDFNPLKGEIIEIKNGLENALHEELKSQKMKTELISNVSHDLKTPLTSIITYVDLLKQDNITEEERKKFIDTIDKKSQRLKYLIEDLFEVSKANSGNIKLNIVDVDVVALMMQTQVEMEDKIKSSGLTFRNTFPDKKLILSLDSEKTYRIFENIIINALKYSLKGSRVFIAIKEYKEYVEIVFKNISAEEIEFNPEEISERFVRGDKSRNTEGSGLGLAIAKSFTEVQNGEFKIEIDGDLFKVILRFKKSDNDNKLK